MESIEGFVIEQLASWEVPGCAIAAVQDGQTVLTAGWGQRDLDTGFPVTSDTLFAIGSVTKAFTAATVGALVDDGLVEWERPLRDYLPELRLYDPVVTDRLTVVDLLSHRSGLPRHDLVWLGYPDRSRAEVVRRLRFLPRGLAFQLLMTGELISAADAHRWGLVNRVCPPGELMEAAMHLAERIAANSPAAVQQAKRSARMGLELPLEAGIEAEIECYQRMVDHPDRYEGVNAFNERRTPAFQDAY